MMIWKINITESHNGYRTLTLITRKKVWVFCCVVFFFNSSSLTYSEILLLETKEHDSIYLNSQTEVHAKLKTHLYFFLLCGRNLKIAFGWLVGLVFVKEDMTNNFYDLMEPTQFCWPFNILYRKIRWHFIHIRKEWNKH